MAELSKTTYVFRDFGQGEILAACHKIGESGDIQVGDIGGLDCAIQSYVDAFMAYLTSFGYGDEAKQLVFVSAFQDMPDVAYRLVLSKLYPDDPGRYAMAKSILYSQLGPDFGQLAYKPKPDEVLKTDSYKIGWTTDYNIATQRERCNIAVTMMYEYELQLDVAVREYVRQCFEKLRDVSLTEREARELIVIKAFGELCPPAFYKAARVIFDKCPPGVAANIADQVLFKNDPGFRDKLGQWYMEHKAL